jgi:hypothetical protein
MGWDEKGDDKKEAMGRMGESCVAMMDWFLLGSTDLEAQMRVSIKLGCRMVHGWWDVK